MVQAMLIEQKVVWQRYSKASCLSNN